MMVMMRAGAVGIVPLVPEQMALIRIGGQPYHYELSFILSRVEGARWVVAGSDGELSLDDLSVEEVVPLAAGSDYPAAGRPSLIMQPVTDARLAWIRAAGRAFTEFHGPPATGPVPLAGGATWLFAGPDRPSFGTAVADADLSRAGSHHVEGVAGFVRDLTDPTRAVWTFVQGVTESVIQKWLSENREGAGTRRTAGGFALKRDHGAALQGNAEGNR